MKVCTDLYPIGSFPNQETPGFYMDETLGSNLSILADRIRDDMMFVFLCTGHGRVRVGKSKIAMQVGRFLTSEVNRIHKLNNEFSLEKNMVWQGEDLIEKALKLEKYSTIILDEGDDLVDNYWSSLSKKLRTFFRKCGQLNLFIILILPDFFELPRSYAITRSDFLIDVKFFDDFRRGMFSFYNFKKKRQLYVQGKKFGDYDCVAPDFGGRFTGADVLDDAKYREMKRADLLKGEEQKSKPEKLNSLIEPLIRLAVKYSEEMKITEADMCTENEINYNFYRKTKSKLGISGEKP